LESSRISALTIQGSNHSELPVFYVGYAFVKKKACDLHNYSAKIITSLYSSTYPWSCEALCFNIAMVNHEIFLTDSNLNSFYRGDQFISRNIGAEDNIHVQQHVVWTQIEGKRTLNTLNRPIIFGEFASSHPLICDRVAARRQSPA
jgi:hypothetical protein